MTKEEIMELPSAKIHEGFQMLCSGASYDAVERFLFPERAKAEVEPKETTPSQRIAAELARRMIQSNARAQDALAYYLHRR